MIYRSELQRTFDDDDEMFVARVERFPTWAEANAWLDQQRTDVSRYLGRYDSDPYRYVLRMEA
jgi:hypothetical protein